MARELMTVSHLIELLSDCDPDARVLIGSQPSWPFEWSIAGITLREDFDEGDKGGDEDYGTFNLRDGRSDESKRGSDVILLEGAQLAYGSKDMWNNPTR